MTGWYAMKRGWLDHEAFKPRGPWSRSEAWVFLVESAAYKPQVIDIGGRPYTVPRGACCFSLRFLATKWKWSVKAVQSFLSTLERHEAVKVTVAKTGNGTKTKRTQITLCNYEKYQSVGYKTETKEKQKSDKEEQGNNTSVPSERAQAPQPVSILTATVWDVGKRYLGNERFQIRDPGSLIGKWLKDSSPSELLSAIDAAHKSDTEDPVPYITKILKGGTHDEPANSSERLRGIITAAARGSSGQDWG